MNRILIIDDDRALCRLLQDSLEKEGYSVCVKNNGVSGLDEALRGGFQLVVLDIMLPGRSGFEVLTGIREGNRVPVLMLTARDSEGDKVSGLRMGADDYLTKPFSVSEFSARVSALVRRFVVYGSKEGEGGPVRLGKLTIDLGKREVFKEERELELTAKEFDLLAFFARHQGQVFTKRQLYNAVWNEDYAYDDNKIMVCIRRLRKKIEDNPEDPSYILTVWGVGYKSGGDMR